MSLTTMIRNDHEVSLNATSVADIVIDNRQMKGSNDGMVDGMVHT